MAVKIVLPGAVMTVQDGGRYGYQETGSSGFRCYGPSVV